MAKSLANKSLDDLKRLVDWCRKRGYDPDRYLKEVARRAQTMVKVWAHVYDQWGHYQDTLEIEEAQKWADHNDGTWSVIP